MKSELEAFDNIWKSLAGQKSHLHSTNMGSAMRGGRDDSL